MMMDWVVALYEKLGRYELEFVEATSGRTGREIAPAMVATYLDPGKAGRRTARPGGAEVEGIWLVEKSEDRITWFWAGVRRHCRTSHRGRAALHRRTS